MAVTGGAGGAGYLRPPVAPRRTSLALAATGTQNDPFGFQVAKNTTGFREPSVAPVHPATAPRAASPAAAAPRPPTAAYSPIVPPPAGPPTPGSYDITTDPSLQKVTALTGMGDEQAQAAALKQRQDLLLGYGNADLIRSTLGDENLAAAAGGSPTSTLAQLGQQRDRNTKALTEGLNADNLLYSGYRVTAEQQAAQDYQSQLAKAAADVSGGLDTISGNLAGALGQNQQSRIAAEQAARDRAVQSAITTGSGAAGDPLAAAAAAGAGGGGAGQPFLPPGVTANTPIAGPLGSMLTYGPGAANAGSGGLAQAAGASLFPAGYDLTYDSPVKPRNTAQIRRNSL